MIVDQIKFRILVEGVLVPHVSRITTMFSANEASSAQFAMPPAIGFQNEHLERARVHIFWSNKRIRQTTPVDRWPILFEGEITGCGEADTPSSRDTTFSCTGLHSYWEQVLYYFFDFSQSATAKFPYHNKMRIFLGNDTIETDVPIPGANMNDQLLNQVREDLTMPYSSIVRTIFSKALNANNFFSIANQALKLDRRFVSPKDNDVSKLINRNLLLKVIDQNVSTLSGETSMMTVIKKVMQQFRYQVIVNGQPRLIEREDAGAVKNSAAKSKAFAVQSEQVAAVAGKHGITIADLDQIGVNENTTAAQAAEVAEGLVNGTSLEDESRDTAYESIKDALISAVGELKAAGLPSHVFEKTDDEKSVRLLSQFMVLPDLRFALPPACNVIFPSENTGLRFHRDFLSEPTRYTLVPNSIAGVNTKLYTAPITLAEQAIIPSVTVEPGSGSGYRLPVKVPYRISSNFGFRHDPAPVELRIGKSARLSHPDGQKFHNGVDIVGTTGTIFNQEAICIDDGIVVHAGWQGGDQQVRIINGKTYKGKGGGQYVAVNHGSITSFYMHLESIKVRDGQSIKAGEAVGTIGSTGASTGPHLHFEVRSGGVTPINPNVFLDAALSQNQSVINLGQGQGNNLFAATTESATTKSESLADAMKTAGTFQDYKFLTPEERIRGIVPYFDYEFDRALMLADIIDEDLKDAYMTRLAQTEFLHRRYATRSFPSLTLPFNPYPVVGLPAVVVRRHRSIVSRIVSITHHADATGSAMTELGFNDARYHDEGDPYFFKNGLDIDGSGNFPDYYLKSLVGTNSNKQDPSDTKSTEEFGAGRDREVDQLYQSMLGCRAIPYYYGERINPSTGVTVSYNKAIDGDAKSNKTIVGKYYDVAKTRPEDIDDFVQSFTSRLGASEQEIMVDFLGSSASASGIEYHGPAFRSAIQEEVRRLNTILASKEAFRG